MASTPSGSVTLGSTLQVTVPAGNGVISQYVVPVQPQVTATYNAGTGANQINKIAQTGGSAAASPASIDLSSLACVDGTTGFAHLREYVIINDDATNFLLLDLTVANAFAAFISAGTGVKIKIEPGAAFRIPKPLGTNGYVVDSTHKIVSLDPGANTIAYRAFFCGD